MALIVTGGEGNRIEIDPAIEDTIAGSATFFGRGSHLVVRAPFAAHSLTVHLGNGARAEVGGGCCAGALELYALEGATIRIGENCAFNGLVRLLAHEPARIELGRGCLVAADVVVTASDMHSVLDLATRERLNRAADVVIGPRVWIGFRALVTKGATIGEGAIIGAQSVVTGVVPAHAMAAGAPARVLKRNVDWTFDLV